MNIDINLPQVSYLRNAVNEKLGMPPRLLSDFGQIATKIRAELGERLSASTMERFWQYSTRSTDSVSEHTLDVLSHFVGYKNWAEFEMLAVLNANPESGFISGEIIDIDGLEPGKIIRLLWLPDRMVKVKYCGNHKFVVVESVRSSIAPGDTFECMVIQKGQPLYLDHFRRECDSENNESVRYVVGKDNGLTDIAVLENTLCKCKKTRGLQP